MDDVSRMTDEELFNEFARTQIRSVSVPEGVNVPRTGDYDRNQVARAELTRRGYERTAGGVRQKEPPAEA